MNENSVNMESYAEVMNHFKSCGFYSLTTFMTTLMIQENVKAKAHMKISVGSDQRPIEVIILFSTEAN